MSFPPSIFAVLAGLNFVCVLAIVDLGGDCSSDFCGTVNSQCNSNNVCICGDGYYDTNGETVAGGSCSRQADLGQTCLAGNDASCKATNSRCSVTSPFRCECDVDFLQWNSTTCVYKTEIVSAEVSVTPTSSPVKGSGVNLTCSTIPANYATSYLWHKDGVVISGADVNYYIIGNVQRVNDGVYTCTASNSYNSRESSVHLDVRYAPEFTGSDVITVYGNFANGQITISCEMSANPESIYYVFYNETGSVLANTSSRNFAVNSSQGYQTFGCQATNLIGTSSTLNIRVIEEDLPDTGASTEDTGSNVGVIVASVVGAVFLVLAVIIIVVCCCNFGYCSKQRKVSPSNDSQDGDKTYIKDELSDSEHESVPASAYRLKPSLHGLGLVAQLFTTESEPAKPRQLPPLDTAFATPKKARKKRRHKRRRKHRRDPEYVEKTEVQTTPVESELKGNFESETGGEIKKDILTQDEHVKYAEVYHREEKDFIVSLPTSRD